MKPLIKQAPSFPVTIYIAGRYPKAIKVVEKYCNEVGYCVTIKPTLYVYKGGEEHGVEVGLINYPRFPLVHLFAIQMHPLLFLELGDQ